ncbi:MAG: UTP--glucose-1-phosphate uridylyltransferase, partial [Chlamydiia bacterium]|nr:UTP--glucose-1-phosphate uridylyltransferase [Chlamydiia bacterium]
MSLNTKVIDTMFSSSVEERDLIEKLASIGQLHLLFTGVDTLPQPEPAFRAIMDQLKKIDSSLAPLGGIVGYHRTFLQLLHNNPNTTTSGNYAPPNGPDFSEASPERNEAIQWGIETLPLMAEVYPVGGAGDRLNWHDLQSGDPLPAATLPFLGHTLLEGLLRDLRARELLHSRELFNPVILMTSQAKNNSAWIQQILEENNWFDRPKELFFLIEQPLIPVITEEGTWSIESPLKLQLKPGGHGAIWQMMLTTGAFDWLRSHNRKKILIRQINNPIAGLDANLLAFTGYGCHHDHSFGFASCLRQVNASEGMNVCLQHRGQETITNIEYTEFTKRGIADEPLSADTPYSRFPSNTNLLFADIDHIEQLIPQNPLPGMILNLKNSVGTVRAGRIETTMQNIADSMLSEPYTTFITFNTRRKTISVAKKEYLPEQPISETPVGAYADWLANMHDLLTNHCHMTLPPLTPDATLIHSPPFHVTYHPALGPLWSSIAQKIRGGILHKGSEIQLDIANLTLENLTLDGSLIIINRSLTGTCTLRNVTITNKGPKNSNTFWQGVQQRHEACTLIIDGDGSFTAENITLTGNQTIHVPAGKHLTRREQKR